MPSSSEAGDSKAAGRRRSGGCGDLAPIATSGVLAGSERKRSPGMEGKPGYRYRSQRKSRGFPDWAPDHRGSRSLESGGGTGKPAKRPGRCAFASSGRGVSNARRKPRVFGGSRIQRGGNRLLREARVREGRSPRRILSRPRRNGHHHAEEVRGRTRKLVVITLFLNRSGASLRSHLAMVLLEWSF